MAGGGLRDYPVESGRGLQVIRAKSPADPPVRAVAAGEGIRILLVDEDGPWRAELCAYFQAEGFQVLLGSHPEEAEALLQASPADLVVLRTPGAGGLNLCRRLSAGDGAPVILVSDRAQEIDRIVGLEVGADDFIGPACSHRELLARIRAVLRRQARRGPTATNASAAGPDRAPIRFAGWTLSPWKLEVQSPDGQRSLLTASDFKLLSALLEHPREAITRERLAHLLGLLDPKQRSLHTGVCRLRRKLGCTPAGEPLIRTVHGIGYMLNCPVEGDESALAGVSPGRKAAG